MPVNPINHAQNDGSYAYRKKAKQFLKKLSLDEKIGQMTLAPIASVIKKNENNDIAIPLEIDSKEALSDSLCSGFLYEHMPTVSQEDCKAILQKIKSCRSKSPDKIPFIFSLDLVDGTPYFKDLKRFPKQIGLAATWNPKLVKKVGETEAADIKSMGFQWIFSPALDLGRNPLWPRHWESFGEDVLLSIKLGNAILDGYQQHGQNQKDTVAACIKNFIGYNSTQKGINHKSTLMPEYFVREYYLPPFKAAIENGAASMMVSAAEINGIPLLADVHYLSEVIRKELGFKDVLLTNWKDIQCLHDVHRICNSYEEAIKLAINAGVDMVITTEDDDFTEAIKALVKQKAISINRVDEAVERILTLKFKLGLFDQAHTEVEHPLEIDTETVALDAARESITLLNNKRKVLPLPTDAKILVTGPTSSSIAALNGEVNTNLETALNNGNDIAGALAKFIPKGQLLFSPGCSFNEITHLNETLQLALESDYIIACMGESPFQENEGNIYNLAISSAQRKFVKALAGTGRPVILVMVTGRPRLITELVPMVSAVLYSYFPGDEGGLALAEILFGKVNPSGKLPFTYPRHPNNILPYDHKYGEKIKHFQDAKQVTPLFEFGHGLSYTKFQYDDLKLSAEQIKLGESIEISVMVTNSGKRAGKEVVQVFISDEVASMSPPVKKLRAFKKRALEPGQSYLAHFEIHTDDLTFVNRKNEWVTEPGFFKVSVGGLETRFEVVE